jgi:hypothetical protein
MAVCKSNDKSSQSEHITYRRRLAATTGSRRVSLHAENSIRPLKPRLRAIEVCTSRS